MSETTPLTAVVTIGLDVHKSSIRLAAVADGRVLSERTLPYDHYASSATWLSVRFCTVTTGRP
jgi:hypothetical protein